jgi:hypothetical protein
MPDGTLSNYDDAIYSKVYSDLVAAPLPSNLAAWEPPLLGITASRLSYG